MRVNARVRVSASFQHLLGSAERVLSEIAKIEDTTEHTTKNMNVGARKLIAGPRDWVSVD